MSKLPPVPPKSQSNKGPQTSAKAGQTAARAPAAGTKNLSEQDRQGNIKQNTTNQGLQQDR